MFKKLFKFFVNGVLVIVPIGLVIYVVVQVFNFLDSLLGNYLRHVLRVGDYVPGLCLLLTIILITLVGWLMTYWFSARIILYFETLLQKIPFVKTLYKLIKETIESIFGDKKSFSKVVLITLPDSPMKMLGFVTTENVSVLGDTLQDHIAVYVPHTFQISGVTLLIPTENVQWLDISPEAAMTFILSGGVTSS